jgi:hypothetical protein
VSGPKSILDALEADDVFVILNLTGRGAGTHVITPDVVYPDGIRLEGVSPQTVEVVISDSVASAAPLTVTAASTLTTPLTSTVEAGPALTPTLSTEGR